MFNSYVLYCQNTDNPLSRYDFHVDVLEALVSCDRPPAEPLPGPAGDGQGHRIEHLPRNALRKCVVCNQGTNKGRTRFWCPGCNARVHRECYSRMKHFWGNPRAKKRPLQQDSDSE